MKFDVVSVKRNMSNEVPRSNVPLGPGETYSPNGGLFSASHQNLLTYIMFAYKISSLNDLEGVPDWVGDQHIDRQLPSGALAGVARPVFDATGLQGNFDFSIEWTPGLPVQPQEFVTDNPGPTFVQAMDDQLGLKLVPRTGPVGVFVIRHIEEPTPN